MHWGGKKKKKEKKPRPHNLATPTCGRGLASHRPKQTWLRPGEEARALTPPGRGQILNFGEREPHIRVHLLFSQNFVVLEDRPNLPRTIKTVKTRRVTEFQPSSLSSS